MRSWRETSRALALVLCLFGTARPGDEASRAQPERIEEPAIENLYRLAPGLYSGGQPEGRAGFEALRRLGVKTIITVDGARPEVELARELGLRYIHLPVGYDGVPDEQATRIVKALGTLPGPAFIHCHHGKHRGPAAAAIGARAVAGWTADDARAWLDRAGTDPAYRGLFRDVEAFRPPTPAALDPLTADDLPEAADVPDLVESMVAIDGLWDDLKSIRAAGFRAPKSSPDLDPPHAALMLAERFREQARRPETGERGEPFAALMTEAGSAAADLAQALRAFNDDESRRRKVESAFERAGKSCNQCHERFRNNR